MGYRNYQPSDYGQGDNFQEGDYRLKIIRAEEATSQRSGNDMIVLEFAIAEAKYTFRYYLVDNEYFDAKATKLFDCFKIQRGNFALESWINKYGRGHIAKGRVKDDGKSYWELAYLIVDDARAPAPRAPAAAQSQAPARPLAARSAPAPAANDFTDDVPF